MSSTRELTDAARNSLESAKDLADRVARFFPEEGGAIQQDLVSFAHRVDQQLEEQLDESRGSTPVSAEVRKLHALVKETASSPKPSPKRRATASLPLVDMKQALSSAS